MGVEENWEPRRESDRDRGMMERRPDKDGFCCQLLAFWRKEDKMPVWKLLHQPNTEQLGLGAASEEKRCLRFWQRKNWLGETMVWGGWRLLFFDPGELLSDSRNSLQWQQEAKRQKTEGSRMFLCPDKCYTCAQGTNQQRKKQWDEWSVKNSSSEPKREGGVGGTLPDLCGTWAAGPGRWACGVTPLPPRQQTLLALPSPYN